MTWLWRTADMISVKLTHNALSQNDIWLLLYNRLMLKSATDSNQDFSKQFKALNRSTYMLKFSCPLEWWRLPESSNITSSHSAADAWAERAKACACQDWRRMVFVGSKTSSLGSHNRFKVLNWWHGSFVSPVEKVHWARALRTLPIAAACQGASSEFRLETKYTPPILLPPVLWTDTAIDCQKVTSRDQTKQIRLPLSQQTENRSQGLYQIIM